MIDLHDPKPPKADACEVDAPNDGVLNENGGAAAAAVGAPNPLPNDVPKPLNAAGAEIIINWLLCTLCLHIYTCSYLK